MPITEANMTSSKRFFSTLLFFLTAYLCNAPAEATLIILKVTAEEVWVAADSKANITTSGKTSFGEAQKIFELDNSCVFAASGLASYENGTVMATDFARRKDTTTKISPDERAHEYARVFSARLKAILEDIRMRAPKEFFTFFLDKVAVSAMFADYDTKPRTSVVQLLCHETSKGELVIEVKYVPQPTAFPAMQFFGETNGALAAVVEGGSAFGKADTETQFQKMFDRQAKETPLWVGPPYLMLSVDANGVHWKHKPELRGTNIRTQ
jgi:hypothetical protein